MNIVPFGTDSIWVWRSLVACLNGVQEAGSSSLLTQTMMSSLQKQAARFLSEIICAEGQNTCSFHDKNDV